MRGRKKYNNKMFKLSIDNDYDFLKEIYCMLKGLISDYVVETRSLCIKIMKELVPDDSNELNIRRNLIKLIKKRIRRPHNENIEIKKSTNNSTPNVSFEENVDEKIVKEIPKEKRKKERSLKPYADVSNRRKK